MQLNKVLKGLLLAVPVLAIAACSSHKSADNGQSGMGAGAGTGAESGNMSSEEQARLQMQELQKNNIVYFGLDKSISLLTSLKCWMCTLHSCAATLHTK